MATPGQSVSLEEFEELLGFFPEAEQKCLRSVLGAWHILMQDDPNLDLNEVANNTFERIKKNFLPEQHQFVEHILYYGRDLLILTRSLKQALDEGDS